MKINIKQTAAALLAASGLLSLAAGRVFRKGD